MSEPFPQIQLKVGAIKAADVCQGASDVVLAVGLVPWNKLGTKAEKLSRFCALSLLSLSERDA